MDEWIWGMYGYGYGNGIPAISGEVEGLLSTAEGRISSALDVGGSYGYGVDGVLLDQGDDGFSFEIGLGGFYDPYDTSGWYGVWTASPGAAVYRRQADGSSGEYGVRAGGNLLTPGVIVSPNGLNAQINDSGGDIMGDDADKSYSAPQRVNQAGGPGGESLGTVQESPRPTPQGQDAPSRQSAPPPVMGEQKEWPTKDEGFKRQLAEVNKLPPFQASPFAIPTPVATANLISFLASGASIGGFDFTWANRKAKEIYSQVPLYPFGNGPMCTQINVGDVQNAIQHAAWLAWLYIVYGEKTANDIAWI